MANGLGESSRRWSPREISGCQGVGGQGWERLHPRVIFVPDSRPPDEVWRARSWAPAGYAVVHLAIANALWASLRVVGISLIMPLVEWYFI